MLENFMVLDEWWPEYHSMTEEEYQSYLEYCDERYEQENNY